MNEVELDERLKFLDPELKATHSRIDVLETICQANTDRIETILANSPKHGTNHHSFGEHTGETSLHFSGNSFFHES